MLARYTMWGCFSSIIGSTSVGIGGSCLSGASIDMFALESTHSRWTRHVRIGSKVCRRCAADRCVN